MITNLSNIGANDRPMFGSKAALLGELHLLGVVIVPGFAISTAYFNTIFYREIETLTLENKDGYFKKIKNNVEFQALALKVNLFLSKFEFENDDMVIVRSSATVEDSGVASFAGQFDSVVVERNLDDVMEGIMQVWFSALRPGIADYKKKIAPEHNPNKIEMGVVVQKHIQFDYSGVLFSKHPTVKLPGWVLVEYVDGNPNKLVDGSKTPTRCRIRIDGKQLVWEERMLGFEKMNQDVKTRLCATAKRVSNMSGYDVDMEWGVKGDFLYILQSRPITT